MLRIGILLALLAIAGCGLEGLFPWDDTCYDCRTVCAGTSGVRLDNCLAACSGCQGRSGCFEALEGSFQDMQNSLAQWVRVDCEGVLPERG